MNNEDEKQEKKTPLYLIVFSMFAVFAVVCGFVIGDGGAVGGFIIGLVFFLIGLGIDMHTLQENSNIREAERMKEATERAAQEREAAFKEVCANGSWTFPIDKFYDKCLKESVPNVDSPFYVQKACNIATTIMEENHVPQEYHHLYVDSQKVKTYYNTGLEHVREHEERARQALERKMRTPQTARVTESESLQILHAKELCNISSSEKRTKMFGQEIDMLSRMINKITWKIESMEAAEARAREAISMVNYHLASASMESKKSWGASAGLADCLMPGLGAAVAVGTAVENAQIEARNQRTQQFYAERSANALAELCRDPRYSTVDLKKERDRLNQQLKDTEREKSIKKVVLDDISSEKIIPHIQLKHAYVRRRSSKVLEIAVDITNNYVPDVPENVKVVVDGTLTAEVYRGDIHVGTAHVPLPLYGILCGSSARVSALCPRYLEGDQQYQVKYTFNDFCVMEL